MRRLRRRAAYYVLTIAVLILVSSVLYDFGMKTIEPGPYPPEGVEFSLFHSMQVVVETFTATGYGSDSPWLSPEMNALVMLLDLTGVALFFLALPAILVPLFGEALSASAPTEVDKSLSDHVVICTYSPRAEVLIEELESHGVQYVLVEPDSEKAIDLEADGYTVVHAQPESVTGLEQTNLSQARALVADISDRVDASIVLAAKEVDESVPVVSVVEDPEHDDYHRLAGADQVLMPRQLLGEGLAQKLTTGVSTDLGEALELGNGFDIIEVPIRHGSELAGTTLGRSRIRERFGVNVIGIWFRGDFESPPSPERPLEGGTILLVTGDEAQLTAFEREIRSTVRRFRDGETAVVGHGEVGQTVTAALDEAGLPYTVIDRDAAPGVDVVGDATDPDVLRAAGVPEARSVVLAIPDDTTTEFATLVVRDLNDSAEILARAEIAESVRKSYRAGADYVLSLATVSGRSIASAVLHGEQVLSVDTTVQVVRTTAATMVGQTLAEADVRDRTGCTVVAVERDGTILTDLDPDFRIESDDELIVAGSDEGTNRFTQLFVKDWEEE